MQKVISTEKIPIKMWLEDIEDGALEQAKNLANLPFAFKHLAVMPDTHTGFGCPIGTIFAAKNAIVPAIVGVDIGCGMSVYRTDLQDLDRTQLVKILDIIKKTIPVGFSHHKEKQDDAWMPHNEEFPLPDLFSTCRNEYDSALFQIGTLGGGNHFIEIQKGSDGFVWVMIHSGSRNLGYKVANHYHKMAVKMNEMWFSNIPSELAFFPHNSTEFWEYMEEMNYCIEFARKNRSLMMQRVESAFKEVIPDVEFSNFINKPHNFAAFEHHFNTNVLVHRKGATRAYEGELGMIPGSQGTNSYIVKGLGNDQSFKSCSHGAGRVMSRAEARRTLSVKDEVAKLKDKGVLHSIKTEKDLDEAPSSYKDIAQVMDFQKDLVKIEVELYPMAVIKG